MKFAEFFETVKSKGVEVAFDHSGALEPARLNNEAMFHLPLIAITVLMLAKGRSKPKVDALGQLVGECFEHTLSGFRGSAQHLGWSAALRLRTVQALTFLEASGLVIVRSNDNTVVATDEGQNVIGAALRQNGDLAITLYGIDRSYRNLRAERQLRMELL
jgi:hypothetical protein